MIIDRIMERVTAELGSPPSWRRHGGEKTHGLVHRYCEHIIDRPLSPTEARRVSLAIRWRLDVSCEELTDAIWAWENRESTAEVHGPDIAAREGIRRMPS